ncbi:hydantoinase/oxoprolinase family protein [Novosphingobium sp. AP12]|uniref:hydantoinase/oxoprolinase family protein n=1 Tax=Novosphingobium sp. AP12 TaxID=1144305 RepID=UPI0002720007|nr:hydantoinase/oxoprolinase family protein [Novosphingobium sp. AP12]EJL30839.1 N-methylhydantoinase A/acetone carboxylase, beta subunit [Novosphingobium sp. AP12]
MTKQHSSVRFSIDTGGTFTDIVVLDEDTGEFYIDKAATTPDNTLRGVINAIDKAKVDVEAVNNFFIHGSTTALNAMLERKGVKTAYVTTLGFRDVPEIMRYNRTEMYNPRYRKPAAIVPRELRFEVPERVTVKGDILEPLCENSVRDVARQIRQHEIKAVAVCLLHSFRNPAHERRIKDILLEENPDIPVAISSDVAAEHREFERGMTAILNAYLAPVVEKWIGSLEEELAARKFPGEVVLTKSDGGGMTPDATKNSPINMLLSGPAGGVIGGLHLSQLTEHKNLITMDVGGTSFDIAMIKNGRATVNQETEVNGYPILISNLDIRTIGAGGGSIAWIDDAGAMHVGPQSAGAVPGPICYRRGGTVPTVTDAFVVNAFIDADRFLGGEMSLDAAGARKAIESQVAEPLGIEPMAASSGILRIAMSNMAEAVKSIAAETGEDPRDFGMLCFGGGGAMFGGYLVDELEMPAAIIPVVPSTFSAFGMLMIDLRHDVVETISKKLSDMTGAELEQRFAELVERGSDLLEREGVPAERRSAERVAEIRYSGQEHAVSVPVTFSLEDEGGKDALYAAFENVYKDVYGYTLGSAADVVNLRVKAVGEIPKPKLREIERGEPDTSGVRHGERQVCDFLLNEWQTFGLYDRAALKAGNIVPGPALIEERTTTTVVRNGQQCAVDHLGNLIITRV